MVELAQAAPRRSTWRRSPWAVFAARRLIGLITTVVVTVVVTFLIIPLLPGDAAVSAAGQDATPDRIEAVREQLGLNKSLVGQFGDYVGRLLRGDLGFSFSLNTDVSSIVFHRLPFTVLLAVIALLVVLAVAIPLGVGVGVATRGGRAHWLDVSFGFVSALLSSIPPYVMATLVVLVLAVNWQIFPPAYTEDQPAASFVLPVLALSLPSICSIARIVRRETSIVLQQDYMRTARGWRLSPARQYLKYAVPNLLTSTLTLSGLIVIGMLGSAVSVETVFAWPGLGLTVVNAVQTKDFQLIQAVVLVLALLGAIVTLLVDVLIGVLDPRTLGAGR
jgi:peptide/nickel transport system permease protein